MSFVERAKPDAREILQTNDPNRSSYTGIRNFVAQFDWECMEPSEGATAQGVLHSDNAGDNAQRIVELVRRLATNGSTDYYDLSDDVAVKVMVGAEEGSVWVEYNEARYEFQYEITQQRDFSEQVVHRRLSSARGHTLGQTTNMMSGVWTAATPTIPKRSSS